MSPRLLALVPAAVAINFAIGRLVAELGLPVYLDAIGTVLATVLAGFIPGLVTGLVSQLLSGLVSGYQWFAFAPIQVLIAVAAWAAATRGGFARTGTILVWGLATGLVAGFVSAAISYQAFEGVTATGVTALTAIIRGLGLSLDQAVLISSMTTDLLDKTLTFFLVATLVRSLPRRMLVRYPMAGRALGLAPSA